MTLNKIWISVLFLLLILPLVPAQGNGPPFQTSADVTQGLIVEFPKLINVANTRSLELNFHVANISSGFLQISPAVSCAVTVYNQSGTPIFIDNDIPFNTDTSNFQVTVTSDNFTVNGDYSYNVNCNNSDIGGFASVPLFITTDGNFLDKEVLKGFPLAIVVSLIGGALIIFLIGNSFKDEDQKWYHLLFRAIFYLLSLGFVALSIGALNRIITSIKPTDSTLLTTVTSAVSLITRTQFVFIVLILLLAILAIVFNVLEMQKRKRNPLDFG